MNLDFAKQNGSWTPEATVNADFNIHIETKNGGGRMVVAISTVADGEKMKVNRDVIGKVYDEDYDGIVYPKYLTITCTDEVMMGVITEAEQ